MKIFATDIIGYKIITFHNSFEAGLVQSIIIDPENGQFLGVKFIYEKKIRVVPLSEILTFGNSFLIIKDAKSISEIDDVVKIEKALLIDAQIIDEKVETESGQKVGKVSNYIIDLSKMSLDKLYVAPAVSINFLASELIIPLTNIIEIKKKKIIVSDKYIKVKKPFFDISPSPVIE